MQQQNNTVKIMRQCKKMDPKLQIFHTAQINRTWINKGQLRRNTN